MRKTYELRPRSAEVQATTDGLQVVLVIPDAPDPRDRLVSVGLVIQGGLEIHRESVDVVFGPRVLRLIAAAIDDYEKANKTVGGVL